MDIAEMKRLIDNKIELDFEKQNKEESELEIRASNAKKSIRNLKHRIDALIEIANYSRGKGMDFHGRTGFGGHEGYDVGTFYTNSWSHLVGFVNDDEIKLLGITAGGACGDINFRTDGDKIYGQSKETGAVVGPNLQHMEEFVKKFDIFESAFYGYIETICKKEK